MSPAGDLVMATGALESPPQALHGLGRAVVLRQKAPVAELLRHLEPVGLGDPVELAGTVVSGPPERELAVLSSGLAREDREEPRHPDEGPERLGLPDASASSRMHPESVPARRRDRESGGYG